MDLRRRVAREAARLLYTGAAAEYKQAKEEGARGLGVDAVPSNFEVAEELDLLADEVEGEGRGRLIIGMREAALTVMRALAEFEPRLIGSVWRGTARRGSDIDIVAFAEGPEGVLRVLRSAGLAVKRVEEAAAQGQDRASRSHHIIVEAAGFEAEVVVRSPQESSGAERCDIYGDLKRGLGLRGLEMVMERAPLRRFVPRRRPR